MDQFSRGEFVTRLRYAEVSTAALWPRKSNGLTCLMDAISVKREDGIRHQAFHPSLQDIGSIAVAVLIGFRKLTRFTGAMFIAYLETRYSTPYLDKEMKHDMTLRYPS